MNTIMSRDGAKFWWGIDLPRHIAYMYKDYSGGDWKEYTYEEIFARKKERLMHTICSILNGKGGAVKTVERVDPITFLVNGAELVVRGWGYLTGVGGLNLPEEEAAKIQDEFSDWIYEILKAHVL